MKRLGIILVLGVVLALLVMESLRDRPVGAEQEKRPAAETNPPALVSLNLAASPEPAPSPATAPVYPDLLKVEEKTLLDHMTSLVDSNKLKQYEGSYTIDELGESSGPGGVAVSLRSSWFTGGTNTPQAGLWVRLNPMSGQYEVVGGEIYLPAKGIGLSRELDEDSGETRTFLNMKKEF